MHRKSRNSIQTFHYLHLAAIFVPIFLALTCSPTHAQEIPAREQSASLQAFGLFSYVTPHYDLASNTGGSFGADLNFRPLDLVQPSIELRATFASGADVSETTYDFGPRIEANLGRLKPYIYALFGTGSITFQHPQIFSTGPYTHDSSFVLSGGIGADYMVTPQIGLRGDIMVQRWNLGSTGTNDNINFFPHLYSVGIDYRFDLNRIRLHRHRGQ